jgi:diguanylate cyclase (GGDEF)-like protein
MRSAVDAAARSARLRRPRALRPAAALAALARLAMAPAENVAATTLTQACSLVRATLGAEEAYIVRTGDPHFVRIDSPDDPTAYEFTQKGYFIVWRELATHADCIGGLFNGEDRRILSAKALVAREPATHLALLLPSDESSSEVLIVRGPWPTGLSNAQVDFATALRPILACLVGALLDQQRRQRQQEQLQSLGAVAAALINGQQSAVALPAIATALAKASGFDWATLTLIDEGMRNVTARALNSARYSGTTTATLSIESDFNREQALDDARWLAGVDRPLLYPNVFAADHERPLSAEFQRYLERAHVLSTATFQLRSNERLLGTLKFSASTVHSFAPVEVGFLALLAEQAVLAIEWLMLHRALGDANAALARAATHDSLTGLPNRALFLDRLAQALAHSQYSGGAVAVLFIDLDDFKAVNDRLGHAAGDLLLRIVADRLQHNLRAGDTAARLGGDEFTVILGDVADMAAAADVAQRLQTAVQQPAAFAGQQIVPAASIGIACRTAATASAESLLREADLAMYQAKRLGKARAA